MAVEFSSVADDFFVNLNLQTALLLPETRETILNFCQAVQKDNPSMTNLYRREEGEYVLEADRESGSYQWLELHASRVAAGYFNPPSLEAAYRMHGAILEKCFYYLGVSGLDVECQDLLFGFNLDYRGNRDELVSRALLSGSPLGALSEDGRATCIEFEPSLVLGIDDGCYRQVRVSVETRGSSYEVRTGQYDDQPVSVYLTVRAYPEPGKLFDLQECFKAECEMAEEFTCQVLIPHIIRPIAAAISTAS